MCIQGNADYTKVAVKATWTKSVHESRISFSEDSLNSTGSTPILKLRQKTLQLQSKAIWQSEQEYDTYLAL